MRRIRLTDRDPTLFPADSNDKLVTVQNIAVNKAENSPK